MAPSSPQHSRYINRKPDRNTSHLKIKRRFCVCRQCLDERLDRVDYFIVVGRPFKDFLRDNVTVIFITAKLGDVRNDQELIKHVMSKSTVATGRLAGRLVVAMNENIIMHQHFTSYLNGSCKLNHFKSIYFVLYRMGAMLVVVL